MVVAVSVASPSMTWRSLARRRMDAMVSCGGSRDPPKRFYPVGWNKESNKERAMDFARKMGVHESTATLDFHSSRVCSRIEYWNIYTHRGGAQEGLWPPRLRLNGSCSVPGTMCGARRQLG